MSHFGSCSYDFVATKGSPETVSFSTIKERPEGRSPLVSIKAGPNGSASIDVLFTDPLP